MLLEQRLGVPPAPPPPCWGRPTSPHPAGLAALVSLPGKQGSPTERSCRGSGHGIPKQGGDAGPAHQRLKLRAWRLDLVAAHLAHVGQDSSQGLVLRGDFRSPWAHGARPSTSRS